MPGQSAKNKSNKGNATKKHLADTFILMVRRQRWESITVKALCEEAGVTRGTFYLYYANIYDLMEQLQTALLDSLDMYFTNQEPFSSCISSPDFVERFDYSPTTHMACWFAYCLDHKEAIRSLLDPKFGSEYFKAKLSQRIGSYISASMDRDGMPKDDIRRYFTRVCLNLYIQSALDWLDSPHPDFAHLQEYISTLNIVRVGACYISWRERFDPDYDKKMKQYLKGIPER